MKKLIVALFSDLHLYIHNVEVVLNLIGQIIQVCIKSNIKQAICLGDVFDSRKAQPLLSLKTFEKILLMFQEANISLICFPGNHDKINYESEDSYLDQYQYWPNFILIRNCDNIDIEIGLRYHFIPYFKEETTYLNYLNKVEYSEGKNILFTHIGIDGVLNNNGEGVKNPVKKSLFKKFDKVFIGHYHNKTKVGDNIYYIGSIQPTNFGEDFYKGCTLLDEDGSFEQIRLDFPKYHVIKIDINKFDKDYENQLLKQYSNSNDNVRFEFTGDPSKIKSLNKSKFEIVGIDIKTKNQEVEEVINITETDEFVEYDNKSIIAEFEEFCKVNELDNIDIGMNYLKKQLG